MSGLILPKRLHYRTILWIQGWREKEEWKRRVAKEQKELVKTKKRKEKIELRGRVERECKERRRELQE